MFPPRAKSGVRGAEGLPLIVPGERLQETRIFWRALAIRGHTPIGTPWIRECRLIFLSGGFHQAEPPGNGAIFQIASIYVEDPLKQKGK